MPELPEVETVCRGLAKALTGKVIARAEVRRAGLRKPFPPKLFETLAKRRIMRVRRRAKYILIDMDDDHTLILHLGMSGRIVLDDGKGKPGKHDHLVLHMDDGTRATLNDPRRFGVCDRTATNKLDRHALLSGLGPEPLEGQGLARHLEMALDGRTGTIKAALLDQRIVAGLGNIYVCEALFYAGIAPTRKAGSLKKDDIQRLVVAVRKVLRAAIKAGGSSLRDYVQTDGELGYFQHHFAVYDRAGQPCPGCDCGRVEGIHRIVQGGRSTYFCPSRQI